MLLPLVEFLIRCISSTALIAEKSGRLLVVDHVSLCIVIRKGLPTLSERGILVISRSCLTCPVSAATVQAMVGCAVLSS